MTSHLLPTYARVDLAFERGEGPWLFATDGERYLDFTAGVAVNALGHAHPHLIAALNAQAQKVWHVSNLFRIPEAELVEEDGKFEAKVSAPGFAPGDIKVTVTPDAMIVRGKSTHQHEKTKGDVRFSEFNEKTLFRRIDLPEPIDPARVSADLDKGVLRLTAAKAVSGKKVAAIAA